MKFCLPCGVKGWRPESGPSEHDLRICPEFFSGGSLNGPLALLNTILFSVWWWFSVETFGLKAEKCHLYNSLVINTAYIYYCPVRPFAGMTESGIFRFQISGYTNSIEIYKFFCEIEAIDSSRFLVFTTPIQMFPGRIIVMYCSKSIVLLPGSARSNNNPFIKFQVNPNVFTLSSVMSSIKNSTTLSLLGIDARSCSWFPKHQCTLNLANFNSFRIFTAFFRLFLPCFLPWRHSHRNLFPVDTSRSESLIVLANSTKHCITRYVPAVLPYVCFFER